MENGRRSVDQRGFHLNVTRVKDKKVRQHTEIEIPLQHPCEQHRPPAMVIVSVVASHSAVMILEVYMALCNIAVRVLSVDQLRTVRVPSVSTNAKVRHFSTLKRAGSV